MTVRKMQNLGIDYKLLFAQIVNFAILFFLFKKFMAGPFIDRLRRERRNDQEKENLLTELQTKHERMLAEEELFREKIKQEREKALDETKKAADRLKADMLEEAKAEADGLVEKAKRQIEEDREKFNSEIKTHIADVSILVIEKSLRQYLTADMQKKLTEHVLSSLKKSN